MSIYRKFTPKLSDLIHPLLN
uniref:Uncharacterized protein n=1 Tax=Anguilla anguilla TaxID=7936 RepID=A0A0E9RBT2_ANGAN